MEELTLDDIIAHSILPPSADSIFQDDPSPDMNSSTTTSSTEITMDSFLNVIQTTALKELQKFTGDPSQKVTQFIDGVERIGSFSKLNDSTLHAIATIKLGGSAFNWYDNNKSTLKTWKLLKTQLLARFKPSISMAKSELKERKQQPGETLLAYYDDVIDLCKQVDVNMPLHMIVDYLQDGISGEFKIQVKRQLKALKGEATPALFLQIARDEDELQKEVSREHSSSFASSQPYFPGVIAATGPSSTTSERSNRTPASTDSRDNRSHFSKARQQSSQPQYYPCLVCGRTNHRTIDCYQRKSQGCYKCGNSNHYIRDCPQVFQ